MRRAHAILLLAAAASHASAQWLLIDRDLNTQTVELTRIAAGQLGYVDAEGEIQSVPIKDLLAVVDDRPPADRPPRELPWITRQLQMFGQEEQASPDDTERFKGALELSDGQRWEGELVGGKGQSLTWLVEETLLLDTPLENVRSAAIYAPIDKARAGWRGLDDRLLLTNGDSLDGFLDAFGQNVSFEYDGKSIDVPATTVAGVLLANPPAAPSGIILRTEGGSVIAVGAVEVTLTGQVSAEVGGESLVGSLGLRTSDLTSIDFAPEAYTGLAAVEPETVSAPQGTPWAITPAALPPGPLGVQGLELRGPVRVDWSLPRPAARFAATAELPPAMWAWGDCELILRTADGREAHREHLNAANPRAEINVPLGGLTGLSIELAPAEGGPVQDTIVLQRPIITWR